MTENGFVECLYFSKLCKKELFWYLYQYVDIVFVISIEILLMLPDGADE